MTAVQEVHIEPSVSTTAVSKTLDNSSFAGDLCTQNHIVWRCWWCWLGSTALAHAVHADVPILTVLLAGQQREGARVGAALLWRWLMSAGVAAVYALIGVIAARTGLALQSYLQNPWVSGFAALSGVARVVCVWTSWDTEVSARWQSWYGQNPRQKSILGAYIMGAASALIASPCV